MGGRRKRGYARAWPSRLKLRACLSDLKFRRLENVFFVGFLIAILTLAMCGRTVSAISVIATGEKWFLEEFHSGRSVSVSDPYFYARTMNFAEITSTGDLIRRGERMSDTHGSMDWYSLNRVLNTVAWQGRILVLGLWVCNFETVTESGIRAFLIRLSTRAAELDTYVIWIPAWEFNQHEDWYYHSRLNWGLGIAGSPRDWYIRADIYVDKMKMIRNVRDSLGIENILIGSQPDSLFRYTYPNWYGEHDPLPLTGQRVLKNYKEGIAQADIIGSSMYIAIGDEDLALTDLSVIEGAFDWMHKIHEYVDSTKPFFAFEYNSMTNPYTGSSNANTFFIENSYKQIPSNFDWGLRGISWWCPFASSTSWQTCSYWAEQYEGYASVHIPIFLSEDDFESGSLSSWTGTITTAGEEAKVVGSLAYNGIYSATFTSDGDGGREYAYCYKSIPPQIELYVRGYFRVTSSGRANDNSGLYFVRLRAGNNGLLYAGWQQYGSAVKWNLRIRDGEEWISVYSDETPTLDEWHRVELHWVEDSYDGLGKLHVNGELVCSIIGKNTAAFGGVDLVLCGLAELFNCGSTTVYLDSSIISNPTIDSSPNGDVNNDYVIDVRDLVLVALAFGSYPGHPKWNPNVDLNNDGVIDLVDLAFITINFGKTS